MSGPAQPSAAPALNGEPPPEPPDTHGSAPPEKAGSAAGRLRAWWPVVRAAIAVTALAVAAANPTETFEVRVVGIALLLIGGVEIAWSLRPQAGGVARLDFVPNGLLVVLGLALLVLPDLTLGAASRLAGALVVTRAIVTVILARPRRLPDAQRAWVIASSLFEGAIGLLLLLSPSLALPVIGSAFVAIWALAGVLALGRIFGRWDLPTEPGDEIHGALLLLADRLARHPYPEGDRAEIDASLFFEGPERWDRTRRFAILLSLATAIATFGLLQSSTAVVIGAMVVAPLMTPMMGLAAAVVTGRPRRALSSVAYVGVGAAWVIALAAILSIVAPGGTSVAVNTEVQARTAPTLLDLLVALAAGAAGAYATGDRKVAAALPGVAIAVALVPPLAAVGICLAAGELPDAAGALLLFLTNFVAIATAGAIVLLLMGYGRVGRIGSDATFARTWAATLGAAIILVAIPLAATGAEAVRESTETQAALREVTAWLSRGPADAYEVTSVRVDGDTVTARVLASADPPPIGVLRAMLEDELGRPLSVVVDLIPVERLRAP